MTSCIPLLSAKVRKSFSPLCIEIFLYFFLFNVKINIILLNKCLTSVRSVSVWYISNIGIPTLEGPIPNINIYAYSYQDKVCLQISLQKYPLDFSYIFLLNVNFENLTVDLYVFYVLNTHVKFHSNLMFLLFN